MRADNSVHLTTAAKQRHEYTRAKALASMHELDQAGAVLTFESVAQHAGVSRSWIYTQPDIKDEIRRLRDQARHQPNAPIPSPQRASDDSLRQRLELANRRNRELADENQRLRRQLAHALGQLRDHGWSRPAEPPAEHRSSITIAP
jgi:hypothetical protein